MMSAVGGGYPKIRCIMGGRVDLLVESGAKCRQGGRGSKILKILQTSYVHGPLDCTWMANPKRAHYEAALRMQYFL